MLRGRVDTEVLREAQEEFENLSVRDLEVSEILLKLSRWSTVLINCQHPKARVLAQDMMLRLGIELNTRDEY